MHAAKEHSGSSFLSIGKRNKLGDFVRVPLFLTGSNLSVGEYHLWLNKYWPLQEFATNRLLVWYVVVCQFL